MQNGSTSNPFLEKRTHGWITVLNVFYTRSKPKLAEDSWFLSRILLGHHFGTCTVNLICPFCWDFFLVDFLHEVWIQELDWTRNIGENLYMSCSIAWSAQMRRHYEARLICDFKLVRFRIKYKSRFGKSGMAVEDPIHMEFFFFNSWEDESISGDS